MNSAIPFQLSIQKDTNTWLLSVLEMLRQIREWDGFIRAKVYQLTATPQILKAIKFVYGNLK